MSIRTEIAELMNTKGTMLDWASRVSYAPKSLSSEQTEISEVIDAWAKEIGRTGRDNDIEISNFITKVIAPEVYDMPDALLSTMFERGSVGEFDDIQVNQVSKNTLKAHSAAKGGNVEKSYIDPQAFTFNWEHKQVETEITYAALRQNGFKSIATLTNFALEALQNEMVGDVFTQLDAGITATGQVFAITGSALTQDAIDGLSLYVGDNATNGDAPFTFSLSKYAQQIAKISGMTNFMSDTMKDEYNRYGLVNFYNGMRIGAISSAHKTSLGNFLVPDKRVFGVAGKVGFLDTRGEIRVLETLNNNKEKVELKITGFEYGLAITNPEKVGKITFSA